MNSLSELFQRAAIRIRQKMNFGRTSYPFLSGDAFRLLADYSITSLKDLTMNPGAKIVFINSDLATNLSGHGTNFDSSSVLIIGNGDVNFSDPQIPLKNFKLILCQNLVGSTDARLQSLPIGLENRKLGKSGLPHYFKHTPHERQNNRISKVLIPPMSPTNSQRLEFDQNIDGMSDECIDIHRDYLKTSKYFELVRNYRFMLCLEGNGYDTHRIWESLYLETFPVVMNTPWSNELRKTGLPVLVIEDLSQLTTEVLAQFASDNADYCSLATPQLWMPYWESKIERYF